MGNTKEKDLQYRVDDEERNSVYPCEYCADTAGVYYFCTAEKGSPRENQGYFCNAKKCIAQTPRAVQILLGLKIIDDVWHLRGDL